MNFKNMEETNGLRFNWNVLPNNKVEAHKLVINPGCLYTPMKDIQNLALVNYNPIICKKCKAILNPYSHVDYDSKFWNCSFCFQRNQLPKSYWGITQQNRPAELHPSCTTIEYNLKKQVGPPPVFLFCIDTCVDSEELEALKENFLCALEFLPENSIVGLLVFGATVQLYELGFSECSKAFVFNGEKSPTLQNLQDQLGFTQKFKMMNATTQANASRFLLPISECEVTLTTIIEELQTDPWPIHPGCRSRRCTGVALSVATSLLELSYPGYGARIVMFLGGPATIGDGKIVGLPFKEQIRLSNDIRQDKAKYFKTSTKFYQEITQRLVQNGHCFDLFCCNLDQSGILELKSCIENTGGLIVSTETFTNEIFQESVKNYLQKDKNGLKMGLNGTMEIITSKDIKICGAIGPVTSMNTKASNVSETEIGYGKTNCWKINSLTPTTTIAVYYDLDNHFNTKPPQMRIFQFITSYQHSSGAYRLRVTTRALKTVPISMKNQVGLSMDQKAATVLLARLAIFKAETKYLSDVLNWLDRTLIHFVVKFGVYTPKVESSLQLSHNIKLFPQFLFNFRRSKFLKTFNRSPDEIAFYRLTLNRENTTNCLIMIQPILRSYSMTQAPHPVMLDARSVEEDNILVLDTFFDLVIHNGKTICQWRDAGYHNNPKFSAFKQVFETPPQDGRKMVKGRFPYPYFVECDQGDSQSRILKSIVNPSKTHNTGYQGGSDSSFVVLTDDASYETFSEYLKKLVVNFEK